MTTVSEILKGKADPSVYTVEPSVPIGEAARLMTVKNRSALVVTEGERIVGIVTERDLARNAGHAEGIRPPRQVGEIMSTDVLSVRPDQTSAECMTLMAGRHVRHLPVVDRDRLVGMVSIRDLMYELVADRGVRMANIVELIAPKSK